MSDQSSVVSTRALGVAFGRRWILDSVDLDLAPGAITALLGRNGGGKSTLLRVLAGILGRDRGSAWVFGEDAGLLPPASLERLVLAAGGSVSLGLGRVGAELDLARSLRPGRWDDAAAREALEPQRISPRDRVANLSLGQRASLRLAMALAARPDLALLDEPALGLDPVAHRQILELILRLSERDGATVLIASHQLHDLERIAERAAFLVGGRIVAHDTLDALTARHVEVEIEVQGGLDPTRAARLRALDGVVHLTCEDAPSSGQAELIVSLPAAGDTRALEAALAALHGRVTATRTLGFVELAETLLNDAQVQP